MVFSSFFPDQRLSSNPLFLPLSFDLSANSSFGVALFLDRVEGAPKLFFPLPIRKQFPSFRRVPLRL